MLPPLLTSRGQRVGQGYRDADPRRIGSLLPAGGLDADVSVVPAAIQERMTLLVRSAMTQPEAVDALRDLFTATGHAALRKIVDDAPRRCAPRSSPRSAEGRPYRTCSDKVAGSVVGSWQVKSRQT